MGSGLSRSGPEAAAAAAQAKEIFNVIDVNHDRKLSLEELVLAAAKDSEAAEEWNEARITNSFRAFDKNNDGYLDEKEFAAALASRPRSNAPMPA